MTSDKTDAAGDNSPAAVLSGEAPAPRGDAPLYRVTLWPHRSLDRRGKRIVLAITAAGLSIPLFPSWGTPVFWGLLPFLGGALVFLWAALMRSDRDGDLTEEVGLWPDEIRVTRTDPDGRVRHWSANPYWVRLALRKNGPVEDYLTLSGSGREIELGAFLAPEERVSLAAELEDALARAQAAGGHAQ